MFIISPKFQNYLTISMALMRYPYTMGAQIRHLPVKFMFQKSWVLKVSC